MDKQCVECHAPTRRLRKSRCDACYMRLYRNGEVAVGASCATCGERRRPVLAMAEVGDQAIVLCGNCTLVLVRARPRIESVADLIRRVDRERRVIPDRRRITFSMETERRAAYRRQADGVETRGGEWDPSVD